jgi:hypothetical protein
MIENNFNPTDQVFENVKAYYLNHPQMLMRLVRANETWALAGRGGGKTSGGIAPFLIDMVFSMPRSSGAIIGLSYEHLDSNTMPPLLKALAEMGYYEGVNYVYGKRPPASWPKPYIPVLEYDHCLIWRNGTSIQKVSLVRKASTNALSIQWGIFDEAKFMNAQQLYDEIFPIFRGNEQYFKHKSEYLSKFFATDKKPGKGAPYSQVKWILDKRKHNDWQLINAVITLQLAVNEEVDLYYKSGKKKRIELKASIGKMNGILNQLRKDLVYVCEFSALENINNLGGEKWLRDKIRNSKSDYDFQVTYLNLDPDKPEEAFYPDFDENIHGYYDENDIEHNLPFIITADYQHSVAPIPISQISTRNGKSKKGLWTVDEVYTLAPQGLSDAVKLFCAKHRSHGKKLVYYVYDHTAVGKRVEADEYYKIVVKVLKAEGWAVVEVYMGEAPSHYVKYEVFKEYLKDTSVPLGINRFRCPKLITSIKFSPAVSIKGKTHKDKTSEQDSDLDQSETTHFSDAWDQKLWAVKRLQLVKMRTSGTGGLQGR